MTQIKVTFLGTTAGIPTKHRNHAAVHLLYRSEQESQFLFDCGEGTQRQIFTAGLNFMRLNEIFISHWHADHFAGLLGLMETMNLEKREKELKIFGPEAQNFVEVLLDLGYASKNFPITAQDVPFEGQEVTTLLDDPEFSVVSIPAKHGIPAVSYAFVEKDRVKIDKEKCRKLGLPASSPLYRKVKEQGSANFHGKTVQLDDIAFMEPGKKVVYSGDTMVTKNMLKLAQNADLLIHDSTFFEEDVFDKQYRHTTFEDVLKLAEEAKVKQVVLTHISRRYQNVDAMKEKLKDYPNARIAKDFMEIVVE
jgi:ribonuclease Z